MNLTEEQRRAVDLVTAPGAPPLAALTGGPGTGKTSTVRAILEHAATKGMRVLLAAPSGKAAQRMEEATGRQASTLHRLLRIAPDRPQQWTAVHCDVLVVDESSMVDSPLMATTLQAARAGNVRTVLLVGDADQLPPVGPGQPFADLLAGGVCPTVRLTTVHRQALESGIVRAAHAIREGRMPELDAEDFSLVVCDDLEQIPATVWGVVTGYGLDADTSQVLAPQRNTAGGVNELNAFIEQARRPVTEGELVRGMFRVGTKVINKKNDYDRMLFNGEIGNVLEATPGKHESRDELHVEFGGEGHTFKGAGIKALRPAWALTVHSYQGSQANDVVVVCHKAHSYMLSRRLLYVAATRAAKRVWIVGQREAVAKAVRNQRDARRETWLAKRFKQDKEAA